MTTIVAHQGHLYGDDLQVVFEGPYIYKEKCKKIFVSKCKQFAYGTIGRSLSEDRTDIEAKIRFHLKRVLARDDDIETEIKFDPKDWGHPSALVITRNEVLKISQTNATIRSTHDIISAMGSAPNLMTCAIRNLNDIARAYKLVAEHDNCTSSNFISISAANLKVFK